MKGLIKLLVITIFSVAMASCSGNGGKSSQTDVSQESNQSTEIQENQDPMTTWNYTKDVDDLTGNTTGFGASIGSTNFLSLNDGSSDRLVIQLGYNGITGKPSNMFGLAFQNGNLRFANKRSQGFLAVFDNGEVDNTWSICNGGNDKAIVMISDKVSGSDHLINSFINKLKNAKTCRIQVNVDGAGMKTFDFNCEGLQWDY